MTDMFFQILFIIVICLGIFLLASWCFSCLYTEWQLDAAERARKKHEEELQVVKEQDPDGTEETNFIEEISMPVDDIPDNKKIKKQIGFNVQIGDGTLPSNQILHYSQNDKKNKMTNSQKQQQFQQLQQMQQANALKQISNLTLQDIQQHQIKQMQQAAIQQQQQRQLEHLIQQSNFTPAELRKLQQQINLSNNSNNIQINVSNNTSNNQHMVAAEIPTTIEQPTPINVEMVVEPQPQPTKVQQSEKQKLLEKVITEELDKEIQPEIVQPQQSASHQITQQTAPQTQQTNQTNEQLTQQENYQTLANTINTEEVEVKLLYRERKLEEYEFFKTVFEIIDLSLGQNTTVYVTQLEAAINEADSRKGKINWKLVPILNAKNHISALEEIAVLLDQLLKSKFLKKIVRADKIKVIDQILGLVLNIITKRLKCPARKEEHQGDLIWIWNEMKETLEREKNRLIRASMSSNQNINKPKLPPKPLVQ